MKEFKITIIDLKSTSYREPYDVQGCWADSEEKAKYDLINLIPWPIQIVSVDEIKRGFSSIDSQKVNKMKKYKVIWENWDCSSIEVPAHSISEAISMVCRKYKLQETSINRVECLGDWL